MDIYEEYIESVIQMADQAIDNSQYDEAKKWFELALYEEPGYAKLHYRIACLLQYNLFNYSQAEKHYWFAIKFNPDYKCAYDNLAELLLESSNYKDLEKLMHAALEAKSLHKAFAYEHMGKAAEAEGDYKTALSLYRKGIMASLENYDVDDLKDHIKRVKYKRFKKRWKLRQRV